MVDTKRLLLMIMIAFFFAIYSVYDCLCCFVFCCVYLHFLCCFVFERGEDRCCLCFKFLDSHCMQYHSFDHSREVTKFIPRKKGEQVLEKQHFGVLGRSFCSFELADSRRSVIVLIKVIYLFSRKECRGFTQQTNGYVPPVCFVLFCFYINIDRHSFFFGASPD